MKNPMALQIKITLLGEDSKAIFKVSLNHFLDTVQIVHFFQSDVLVLSLNKDSTKSKIFFHNLCASEAIAKMGK